MEQFFEPLVGGVRLFADPSILLMLLAGMLWGSIAGGLIIGIAEVLAIGYFGGDFVDIAVFGLLLLLLFVRPTGLFSRTVATRGGI